MRRKNKWVETSLMCTVFCWLFCSLRISHCFGATGRKCCSFAEALRITGLAAPVSGICGIGSWRGTWRHRAFRFLSDSFIQANKISFLFKDIGSTCEVNRENIDKNITKIVKNYKEKIRDFGLEDSLWGISLIFGLIIQFTGIRYQKFVLFYISYYYFRMDLGVFGKVFKIKCVKVAYSVLVFFFVIANFLMAMKTDLKLFNVKKINLNYFKIFSL